MKPIIEKQAEETILTSEITNEHIVVGFRFKKPVILINKILGDISYNFICLDNGFTRRNGYGAENKSIKYAVEKQLKYGEKTEVFHENDWKKALQWLIDNAE